MQLNEIDLFTDRVNKEIRRYNKINVFPNIYMRYFSYHYVRNNIFLFYRFRRFTL